MKTSFSECNYIDLVYAKQKVNKYNCISFDVFDTLIKRNVSAPNELFKIMEPIVYSKYKVSNFAILRIQTERYLYSQKSKVTLDLIYKKIAEKIGYQFIDQIKEEELKLELSYCQPNWDIKELFDYCKATGKHIIAISDMYLPSEHINRMLLKCGYNVDALYVSCECAAKKADGSLFEFVLQKEGCKRNSIIHIGDSLRADFIGAMRSGVNSIKIETYKEFWNTTKFQRNLSEPAKFELYKSVINNNLPRYESYYSKFGFAYIGPIVFCYVKWLLDRCQANKITNVFFFARDGHVLKKAFDYIKPTNITTHYLYVSRRALRIPFASTCFSYEKVIRYLPKVKLISMRVVLENLGLEAGKYENNLRKHGFSMDESIQMIDLLSDVNFKNLFEDLKDDILKNAQAEYNTLKKYLVQEGFKGKLAVVDIGWHNSMQYHLEELPLQKELGYELYGYYIGKQSKEIEVKNSEGFIKDSLKGDKADSTLSYIGLMESIFLAQEGSTKSYKTIGGSVVPELLEYEYCEGGEKCAFIELQQGIQDFVVIMNQLIGIDNYLLNGYDAFLPLKTFGIDPYLGDVEKFFDFRFFSEEIVYFANSRSIFYYLSHVKQLKNDLLKARWKIGFMKRLLKINIPYYKIYVALHNHLEKKL